MVGLGGRQSLRLNCLASVNRCIMGKQHERSLVFVRCHHSVCMASCISWSFIEMSLVAPLAGYTCNCIEHILYNRTFCTSITCAHCSCVVERSACALLLTFNRLSKLWVILFVKHWSFLSKLNPELKRLWNAT